MIVKLTWHGEPIGKLDVQFVWPPPLDRGALLPLLSASSGSAAISVVFQFAGPLDALELDLAKPLVLRTPLGGPTQVGPFHGHVEARFDELDVHGFVAAPLGSRGGQGPRVSIQRGAGESEFSVSGGLSGHVDISSHSGPMTFAAAVEGSRSQVRAYPNGGGIIEMRSARRSALIVSLNWRWPRSFDEESPWAVALQALLKFITEHPSTSLRLGFELAPEDVFGEPALRSGSPSPQWDEPRDRGLPAAASPVPTMAAPSSERATGYPSPAPATRIIGASSVALLGSVAVALVVFIAAVLLWKPSGTRNDSTVLLPAGTVSSGALRPVPRSAADRDAGRKR